MGRLDAEQSKTGTSVEAEHLSQDSPTNVADYDSLMIGKIAWYI